MVLLYRVFLLLLAALVVTSAQAAQVTCESQGKDRTSCPADLAGGAELLTQLSGAPCTEGRTWGTDRTGIWVSDGCRAVFKVAAALPGIVSPPSGQSAQWQRGFADGQRGAYDERSHPRDYRDGYKEGEQAAINSDAQAQPGELAGADRDVPAGSTQDDDSARPQDETQDRFHDEQRDAREPEMNEPRDEDERRGEDSRDERGMNTPQDPLQRACAEEAALGEAYPFDQVVVRERRSIGRGLYEIDLDTPDGPLVCTIDREARVRSIDEP